MPVQPEPPSAGDETTHKRRVVRPMSEALIMGDEALPGEGIQAIPVEEPSAMGEGAEGGEGGAQGRRIVRSAGIIMVGQLLSSIMGMVRIEIINILFYGAASGAFIIALRPIQQVSDLLIGGSVSGALIPTFVDYSEPEKRAELRRVYSTVATLALLVMAVAVALMFFLAPWLAPIYLGQGTEAERELTASFIRVTAFGLFGLALYAIGSALLYSLKDVVYPAFATFIQHVGVIAIGVIALFLAAAKLGAPVAAIFAHGAQATSSQVDALQMTGAIGLAVGFVVGALGEAALLLPGLRRNHVSLRPTLHLNHPAVRQILRLYLPIAAGLLISVGQQQVELWLNGRTNDPTRNITALQSATTLIQFPTGLVVAALSFAVLPPLAAAANNNDLAGFKRTLALGFRLGLLLMTPAMVGLIAMGTPITALLFQHGACHTSCTDLNTLALTNYAYQLPFLALDQMLIAAFYARKNTITPVVVGVVSIGVWALVAVPFTPRIGMPALALANAALNSSHAIILFILLTMAIGSLGMRDLWSGVWRITIASALMGGVIVGLLRLLPSLAPTIFTLDGVRGQLATVLAVGVPAAALYFLVVTLLGMNEVRMLGGIVRARLGGRRG
ncbi:MAG TPA: lipid II flippase MurJ [Ktedonobacterales bacterium]|nr:lipid II flippase MurJ [Ktedonobacterales bacterium]